MVDMRDNSVHKSDQPEIFALPVPSGPRSALSELERMNSTVDFRRGRRTQISAECGRCGKWKFLTDLTSVSISADGGQKVEASLCPFCLRSIRRIQTETAALRHDLPDDVVKAIYNIHKATVDRVEYLNKFRSYLLSLDDLLSLWIKQDGMCAMSGAKMRIDLLGTGDSRIPSVDRIDNAQGY